MPEIPFVDLTAWFAGRLADRTEVASALDEAFRTSGFALVTGHGVDPCLGDALRAEARGFFEGPVAAKEACRAEALGRPGWIPPGAEANGYVMGVETPPDLKESLSIFPGHLPGRAGAVPPNRLPTERPGLEATAAAWMTEVDALFLELLRMAAVAMDAPPDHFADGCAAAPNNLYVNWYPALASVGPPAPGQFRIGPHADFGTLTVLDRQQGLGGLQVQPPGGGWVDAPFVPGALTVNVGDMLARWSGGRWRSATHRVLPPSADAPDESLISLIYFAGAEPQTVISPLGSETDGSLDGEPVRAGAFLQAKLDRITVTSES